ncbi:MAG: gluconate 2-dehydrogenase subunit 3 family protein [Ferruginibacter sp.]|nr:gluconate 2-dehydrogenase subunit 3 family protein [Ferruginibacter sp.]
MKNEHYYTKGTVTAVLRTDAVTDFTKEVLLQRMVQIEKPPTFFTIDEINLLSLVCDLLLDQDKTQRICNPAIEIDRRLTKNDADGWRYDRMPTDRIAYKKGLQGIEESAHTTYVKPFAQLQKKQQAQLLQQLQTGNITGTVWQTLPAKIFFEELLAEVVAIFYSHPLAQEEIGYTGMADAAGWHKIGLNEKDEIEADELTINKNT